MFELDDGDPDGAGRVASSRWLPTEDYELWSLGPDRIDGTRIDIYALASDPHEK
ncbi:MAG: hypothetical protein R3B96_25270 [Pirellulaceae bacterium]